MISRDTKSNVNSIKNQPCHRLKRPIYPWLAHRERRTEKVPQRIRGGQKEHHRRQGGWFARQCPIYPGTDGTPEPQHTRGHCRFYIIPVPDNAHARFNARSHLPPYPVAHLHRLTQGRQQERRSAAVDELFGRAAAGIIFGLLPGAFHGSVPRGSGRFWVGRYAALLPAKPAFHKKWLQKILCQNICTIKNGRYICQRYSERSPIWRAGRVTFVFGREEMYKAEAEPCKFLGFAGVSPILQDWLGFEWLFCPPT